MQGSQIENLIKKDQYTKRRYAGAFCADTIPMTLKKGFFYLLNESETSDALGSHWTVISCLRPNQSVDYLCSFGGDGKNLPRVHQALLGVNPNIYSFDRRLQTTWSSSCRLYCVFFFYALSRGISPPEILSDFFA